MTKLADILKDLVEAEAAPYDAFVTGHSAGNKGLYRYYIDSGSQLTMNVLTEITRHVSEKIDAMDLGDEPFTFEISSPGADSPLTDLRQYTKHIGRNFHVEADGETFDAKLSGVHGDILSFEEEIMEKTGSKRTLVKRLKEIPFEKIQKATIKISFK